MATVSFTPNLDERFVRDPAWEVQTAEDNSVGYTIERLTRK